MSAAVPRNFSTSYRIVATQLDAVFVAKVYGSVRYHKASELRIFFRGLPRFSICPPGIAPHAPTIFCGVIVGARKFGTGPKAT